MEVKFLFSPPLKAGGPPETAQRHGTCEVCSLRIVTVEPGQTTHPNCEPAGGSMDERDVWRLLAGELGARRIPAATPQWASAMAKRVNEQRRRCEQAATAHGLTGRLSAEAVGTVSARVDWQIVDRRQFLDATAQEALRTMARRYADRHAVNHKLATQAHAAVGKDYLLAVISRADLDAFLTELVLTVKGAP